MLFGPYKNLNISLICFIWGNMAEKSINITLETIFDLLRREKSKEELQKLDSSFYQDLVAYLNEKKAMMESQQKSLDLFTEAEKEKSMIQFNNIKRMVKDLYERREKKIINMALNKSKTNAAIIDTSTLLDEERIFYEELVYLFNKFRQDIVLNLIEGIRPRIRTVLDKTEVLEAKPVPEIQPAVEKRPEPAFEEPKPEAPALVQEEQKEEAEEKQDIYITPQPKDQKQGIVHRIAEEARKELEKESFRPEPAVAPRPEPVSKPIPITHPEIPKTSPFSEQQESQPVEPDQEPKPEFKSAEQLSKEAPATKMVRFLKPIPKFVGEELEIYGPFDEEDIANLPIKIAELLIKKGRVEEIGEG